MRWIAWVLLAALAVSLQTTLAGRVEIGPIRPDWPFLLVVALALTAPVTEALYAAVIIGAFVDLSSVIPFGTFTFPYGLAAFLIVRVRELLFRNRLVTYTAVTLLAGSLVQLLIALFRPFQEGAGQYDGSLFLEAVGITLYTVAWSVPAHWLFLKSRRLFGFAPRRRTGMARL